jgi:hypothetical protein
VSMDVKVTIDERAIEAIAREALEALAADVQVELDRLHRTHGGRPASEVEPQVRALFRRLGWKPSHPGEVRDFVEVIASGRRVVLRPQL